MSELTNPVYRLRDIHVVITLWYYAVTYGSSFVYTIKPLI